MRLASQLWVFGDTLRNDKLHRELEGRSGMRRAFKPNLGDKSTFEVGV